MAVSLLDSPSNYSIAYRPVEWQVQSSITPDVMEFQIYDNLTADALLQGDGARQPADFGQTQIFTKDFRTFIQDNLGTDINTITPNGTHYNAANILRDYYITATEQTLSASGQYVDGDTYTSSAIYVVNATREVGETDLVVGGYFVTTNGAKILTNKPQFITRDGESEYVALYNNDENIKVTVVTTSTAGILATGVVNSLTLGNKVAYLGIGWENINALTLNTGSQPLITSNTASYTVQFETVTTGNTFELITVTCDQTYRPNQTRFVFQNEFGAIDFFTAWRFTERFMSVDGVISQKPVSDFTSVTSYGRFKSSTSKSNRFIAGTSKLTEDEAIWLEEMLSSANVWIQEGTSYRPVIIDDVETKTQSTKDGQFVYDLQISYSYANDLTRQKA